MKVLFLVHNLGKTRHFEGVIQGLTERGLEQPVAPLMVDEIEQVAKLPRRPHRLPIWQGPARRILLALLKSR